MNKRERPKLGDTVEFINRGHTRVGKIVAVDGLGVYFVIESDHTKYAIRRGWDLDKKRIHIPLSKIKKIIPPKEAK